MNNYIPTLEGDEAEEFIRKAESAERGTVDWSRQIKQMECILEKYWVKWNYEESSEGNVYPVEYGCELDDIKNNPNIVKPIPLTEEWLESTKIDGTSFGTGMCFTIWTEGSQIYLEQYGEGRVLLDHIEYRHQAQNLYFALTGEELTLTK